MSHSQPGNGDEWERLRLSFTSQSQDNTANDTPEPSATDLEPGWCAVRSLVRIQSDELLAVTLRPSFRPVLDSELVQVLPCPYCMDGGLRTAGTVRTRSGRARVRACDTCAKVEIERRPRIS